MKRLFLYSFLLICSGITGYLAYINLIVDLSAPILPDHIRNISTLQSKKTVYLYFSSPDENALTAEEQKVTFSADASIFGRKILEALIQGPHSDLAPTLPASTKINALFVTPDKTAYIDFSDTIRQDHPGGTLSELATIYSIVNSLTLNIPAIDAVKLLIDGQESLTLAGHIDLSAPFKANILIIR